MPHAHQHEDLDSFVQAVKADKGFWSNMRSYVVSLLKARSASPARRTRSTGRSST